MRLARENNEMLHSMRRNSFMWGLIKVIFYGFLFAAPLWFYMTYVSSDVDTLIAALDRANGTAASAQQNVTNIGDTIKNIESALPSWMHPAAPTTTPPQQ